MCMRDAIGMLYSQKRAGTRSRRSTHEPQLNAVQDNHRPPQTTVGNGLARYPIVRRSYRHA
eukprot:4531008-Alexandrium_andersonii.AAC.1